MKQNHVKEHFSKQADDYEKIMVRLVPQFIEQHQIISELLPPDNKEYKALDLGCGNGVLSEVILDRLTNAYVVGFDLTEDMLKAYQEKLGRYSGKYELQAGDFRYDSVGSGYDIIIAGLTLHHLTWEERKKLYITLFDSMNPGGLFIARDIILDEDEEIRKQQYDLWKSFMKSKGEDPEFWYEKHMEKDHPIPLSKHLTWLLQAGFEHAACHWRLFNFAITSARKA